MTRIIYHPAPLVDADGRPRVIEPVDLGTDPESAVRWIRRRLGIAANSEVRTVFTAESLDLAALAARVDPKAKASDAEVPDAAPDEELLLED